MAAAGAIMGLVGGGISAYGQLQQGAAAKAAGEYNANIARINEAQINAESPIAVQQVAHRAEMAIGKARAQFGASGVQSTTGSALAVLQQSASQAALDEALVKHSYDMKAFGYESTAVLDIFEGNQAASSSQFAAAGSLLGASGGAAGKMGGGGGGDSSGGSSGGSFGGGGSTFGVDEGSSLGGFA